MSLSHRYVRRVVIPASAAQVFRWHEAPGALERLIPPWENVSLKRHSGGLESGAQVELINQLGPFRVRWLAEHRDYDPPRQFRDVQLTGPFTRWEHTHRVEPQSNGSSILEDEIQYELPGGTFGRWFGHSYIRRRIDRMFQYRHATTVDDLAAHASYAGKKTMHIAMTGSHGLVGSSLLPLLTTGGHRVTRLVRGSPAEGEVKWDPQGAVFDARALDGVDAVVHLAGENIAGARWNEKVKQRIRDSRVQATRVLCSGLASMTSPPKTLVCASAVGFYGDRGDEVLTEDSPAGNGFLAEVVREWEAACAPAREAGIRVVNLRFAMILSPKEGALAKMLTPFKLGGGGTVGSGRQYWSWISIDDAAGSVLHALMSDSLSGPVNAVAPQSVTNAEFTKTLGKVLQRPTLVPMPAFAARLALGEMADELLLASIRAQPRKLLESNYVFRQSTLEQALRHLLGK
jgi:uncharacterized protein (TIGR01777 family)